MNNFYIYYKKKKKIERMKPDLHSLQLKSDTYHQLTCFAPIFIPKLYMKHNLKAGDKIDNRNTYPKSN